MFIRMLRLLICLSFLTLMRPIPAFAQDAPPSEHPEDRIESIEVYVKIVSGVIAGLVAIFGLPLTVIQFQKTRAEIRKLELEAATLEGKGGIDRLEAPSTMISITDSPWANVQILADPRFLGPLLLLLDFIIAWIVLTLFNYALSVLSFIFLEPLRYLMLAVIAAILLLPIASEASRVKKSFRDEGDGDQGLNSTTE